MDVTRFSRHLSRSKLNWGVSHEESQIPGVVTGESASLKAEVSRLKAELKRANEERDILNKAATYFAKLSG